MMFFIQQKMDKMLHCVISVNKTDAPHILRTKYFIFYTSPDCFVLHPRRYCHFSSAPSIFIFGHLRSEYDAIKTSPTDFDVIHSHPYGFSRFPNLLPTDDVISIFRFLIHNIRAGVV